MGKKYIFADNHFINTETNEEITEDFDSLAKPEYGELIGNRKFHLNEDKPNLFSAIFPREKVYTSSKINPRDLGIDTQAELTRSSQILTKTYKKASGMNFRKAQSLIDAVEDELPLAVDTDLEFFCSVNPQRYIRMD